MPKRLFVCAQGGLQVFQFTIGQGITAAPVDLPAGASLLTVSSVPIWFKTHNEDFAGAASGGVAGTEGFFFLTDPFDLTTGTKITAPLFSGAIYAGAASNEFMAIGGASPFLYVLSRADLSLKTVSTAGLGNVFSVAFSHDGSMLAVLHSTAPFLRIYKTSDWSFVNVASGVQPGSPSQQINGLAFSVDGTKLIVATPSNLDIYNPLTLARNSRTATAGAGKLVVTKSKPDEAFMAMSGASNPCAARINLSTGALTGVSGAPNTGGYSVALDESERVLYVSMNQVSDDLYIRRFNADTLQELPHDRGSLFQQVRMSNAALMVMDTTKHQISGAVRDVGNNPAERQVEAFDRDSARLVAKTLSDPVTGNYVLRTNSAGPFDVRFKAANGELLNDLFYAKVMAEPIA